MYPVILFLVDKLKLCSVEEKNYKVQKAVRAFAMGKSYELAQREYVTKKMATVVAAFLAIQCLVLLADISMQQEISPNGESVLLRTDMDQTIPMEITITDEEEQTKKTEEVDVTVSAYYGREKQAEELQEQVADYMESALLGENESLSTVVSDLVLPQEVPDTKIRLVWESDHPSVIDASGHVSNESITEVTTCTVTASIYEESYEKDYETDEPAAYYEQKIRVLPKSLESYQDWLEKLQETMTETDQESVTKKEYILPSELEGRKITYQKKQDNQAVMLWGLGFILCILFYFAMDEQMQQQLKKREVQMQLDYPEILNKFTLLMSGGMTITGAWNRIVSDYMKVSRQEEETQTNPKEIKKAKKRLKKKKKIRYAYEEMRITNQQLQLGVSKQSAIEEFGQHCGMVEYMKFASIVVSNLKKGSANLTEMLEAEAINAFEERKALAVRLGEEAGTKQLLPMFIMLILVIVVIMVPAFWSMQL